LTSAARQPLCSPTEVWSPGKERVEAMVGKVWRVKGWECCLGRSNLSVFDLILGAGVVGEKYARIVYSILGPLFHNFPNSWEGPTNTISFFDSVNLTYFSSPLSFSVIENLTSTKSSESNLIE
jgi:hypothetical protein